VLLPGLSGHYPYQTFVVIGKASAAREKLALQVSA